MRGKLSVLKTSAAVCLILMLFYNHSIAQPTSTGTPEPTKVMTLRLADYDSAVANVVYNENLFQWWAKEVNKRTGGRINVQVFHSETLAKSPDFLNALDTGICDVAHVAIPGFPGRFPISEFLIDTPVCFGDPKLIARILDKLVAGSLMKEFDAYVPTSYLFAGSMCLFTTKKKVSKLEDLKGLKIRVRGTPSSRLVEGLGATPVTIGSADLYTALERGTIDGIITSITYVEYTKLYEVTRYFIDHGFTGGLRLLAMSRNRFNSLPLDIQKILMQLGQETGTRYLEGSVIEGEKGRKAFKEHGGAIYKLDPAEWARFMKVMDSVVDGLAGGLAAKGVPWPKVKETIDAAKASFKLD